MLEDDEPAELLADEDRVREALSAAVDVQYVPPVRTDLVQIVELGRRRARLQVLAASVGAVVLIAAVALGATVLGRHGGSAKIATAAGQPPLPVTTQVSTSTMPPTTVLSGLCIFPNPVAVPEDKWLSPSAAQEQLFSAEVQEMVADAHVQVVNAIDPSLAQQGSHGEYAVQVIGDPNYLDSTVILQQFGFSGTAAEAATLDVKRAQFSAKNCTGQLDQTTVGNGMVANQYTAATDAGQYYVRVQLYDAQGQRLDITELTDSNADQPVTEAPTSPTASGTTGSATTGSGTPGSATPGSGSTGLGGSSSSPNPNDRPASPLTVNQLLSVAVRVDQLAK